MSLMRILKSSAPNIDLCGAPADIFSHLLKELFILQRWSLFVRQPLIKLTALLSKSYASNFSNNKSWLRLSKAQYYYYSNLDPLFDLASQDSIILKSEFCVLWFLRKPRSYLENSYSYQHRYFLSVWTYPLILGKVETNGLIKTSKYPIKYLQLISVSTSF